MLLLVKEARRCNDLLTSTARPDQPYDPPCPNRPDVTLSKIGLNQLQNHCEDFL